MQDGRDKLAATLSALKNDVGAFPVIGRVEKAFDSVGLMRGSLAPLGRAAVGFALATGVVYALNGFHLAPFAFDDYGNARPWKYDDPEGTSIPWWMPGVGVAFLCGALI